MSQINIKDDASIIEPVYKDLKKNFRSGQTKDLTFRKQQLENILKGLSELESEISDALRQDLGYKNKGAINLFGMAPVKAAITHSINHMKQYSKPRPVKTNILVGMGKSYVVPEPYGTVLVIGSWNYPLVTALQPAAEAIAAGNCVVMKPSELAPKLSNVLRKLFEKYLDSRFYRVIEGQVQVAIKITTFKWDLIIFTGSPQKGQLVAKSAAENLVPCILELGGKSPTIIDENADIQNACKRICVGKFINCGQTCIAPDYILVDEKIKDQFIDGMKKEIQVQFSSNTQQDDNYQRVVTEFHTERLVKMVEEVKSNVVYGGKSDVKDRYVEPTLVLNPSQKSLCMVEEIFGPILPIITYKDFQKEVIDYINDNEKPLALYYFGTDKQKMQKLENETSSGAFSTNDCVMHIANNELPFGGVGQSGISALHGQYGFDACSHLKPVLKKDTYNGWPITIRFPPYTDSKQSLTKKLLNFAQINNEDVINVLIKLFILVVIYFLFKTFFLNGQQQQDL